MSLIEGGGLACQMVGISMTASYALRILIFLTRYPGEWVRRVEVVADGSGIPRSYAAKILHELGRIGLVRTKVGCRGGYRLAGDADRISALDVVAAVDGPRSLERCLLGHGRCSAKRNCALHPYWSRERARIERRLEGLTLAKLASHPGGSATAGHDQEIREIDRGESGDQGH